MTWKRNLSPDTASEYAQALFPIAGAEDYNTGKSTDPNSVQVRATDDRTLVVRLAEPAPYFLALVSTWTYAPLQRATVEKNGEKWVEASNMVSAGKYKLQTWEHDQRMVLVRDDNYWGEKPTLQQINFIIYKDIAASSLPAYERGEIDVVTTLSADDLERVRNNPQLRQELNLVPISSTSFVCFDVTNTNSPVSKKEFRQAVYFAINRERLANDVRKGQILPAASLLPKTVPGSLGQPVLQGNLQRGDPERARALLQQAGYSGQQIVYTHSDQTLARLHAQALQQDLAAVGINVRLDVLERRAFTQWREARKDQAFDMYLGGWFSDYEDPSNWHNFFFGNPDQEFWHTHFSQLPGSRAYLDLIRRANQERNRQQREQLYQQAERILLEELPLAPVFNQQDVVMVKPYVKGLVHTNLSQDLFGGVKILAR